MTNHEKIRLIIRTDDIGMCHAVNEAFARIAACGMVTAASVMTVTGWLDEAVEILQGHPQISVGVHTALNSEWHPYRWGPVSPLAEVPSLVDPWGKFFPSSDALLANRPNPVEVAAELRAQIALARRRGLPLSYIDHHMMTIRRTAELRDRLFSVAGTEGLGISGRYREKLGPDLYSVPIEEKTERLIEGLRALPPGLHLIIGHPGLDVPEMQVLRDQNVGGLPDMARHRQAETDALCDPRVRAVIQERGIELVGYRDLAA